MEKHDEKEAAMKERLRNCEMGAGLIQKNANEALVIYTGPDGGFYYSTANRTWAMGALQRCAISLEERERIDTRTLEDEV